ncbi:hypothetical protein DL240_08995 [Lujinxingia litoralis]|uniref:Right handed beta helix domain-containing protein n=1 Tax=Lujinxingia litoralis TaxID=2211119 RepID=A0A328C8S7_9DELT|nr:hypothetical protein [Lujinxingia litoralis]RAL23014.1 hypothetical protein DL240_08995 [Lujinxingia litoralis]
MMQWYRLLTPLALLTCGALLTTACVEGPADDGTPDETGEPVELSGDISADRTVGGDVFITSSLTVHAKLSFEACSTVKIASGAVITVENGGAIEAIGEADCPVVIESASANPSAGDWERIDIYASADNANRFEHAVIRHGDGEGYGMIWVEEGAQISLSDVALQESAYAAIQINGDARVDAFSNVSFKDIGGPLVSVSGERAHTLEPFAASGTNPQAYVAVMNGDMKQDVSWKALGVPYVMQSQALMADLTLEAGVTLQFEGGGYLRVSEGGQLRAMGSAELPVVIESAKSNPAAGDWATIEIYGDADNGSRFQHTTVRHGGGDGYGAIWLEAGATIELEDVTFSDNQGCDIDALGTVNATNADFVTCD